MELNLVGLIINVPEFIWTIINFFLLMFLLKKFLYTPVLRVLDERKAYVESGLEEGRAAEKALIENDESLKAELTKSGAEAREMISAARSEAEKAKTQVVNAAHTEAASIHKNVQQRVEDEEAQARKAVADDMPELVALLARRLLKSDEAEDDLQLIRSCIAAEKE